MGKSPTPDRELSVNYSMLEAHAHEHGEHHHATTPALAAAAEAGLLPKTARTMSTLGLVVVGFFWTSGGFYVRCVPPFSQMCQLSQCIHTAEPSTIAMHLDLFHPLSTS